MHRAIKRFAAPKRRQGSAAARLSHQHIIMGNAVNTPMLSAQGETVAGGGLPDKFLIQFAQLGTAVFVF